MHSNILIVLNCGKIKGLTYPLSLLIPEHNIFQIINRSKHVKVPYVAKSAYEHNNGAVGNCGQRPQLKRTYNF